MWGSYGTSNTTPTTPTNPTTPTTGAQEQTIKLLPQDNANYFLNSTVFLPAATTQGLVLSYSTTTPDTCTIRGTVVSLGAKWQYTV